MTQPNVFQKLAARENLTIAETQDVFDQIFDGLMPREQIAALLLSLRNKGETTDEIIGATQSMRAHMLALSAPDDAIDIVGTGGDGHGTLNVSTAAALVVAACGVPVAKHGNRAATSLSGSSDTLGMLGINLTPEWDVLEKCLNDNGIVFLYAPRHHPAMRHVAEVRKELGVRTIFNLLGPLTNPANVKLHMIGVYAPEWLKPMAEVLKTLGSRRAWLAHGEGLGRDGLDEISTIGPTRIVELKEGEIGSLNLTPEEFGLPRARLDDLKGGDARVNAEALRKLLKGKQGAYRDIVLMNAAAALVVAGKSSTMADGLKTAATAIDSGAAQGKLEALAHLTSERLP
ncbi:MAG: anthranilate phosphoribosyltransferase [Alphaproteobacteria bacterium]|nr:anthranilate phosphoribosyltransferase [Alphaproteobacteria bacterium]